MIPETWEAGQVLTAVAVAAFLGTIIGFATCYIIFGSRQDALARAEQAGRLAERRERRMGRRVG